MPFGQDSLANFSVTKRGRLSSFAVHDEVFRAGSDTDAPLTPPRFIVLSFFCSCSSLSGAYKCQRWHCIALLCTAHAHLVSFLVHPRTILSDLQSFFWRHVGSHRSLVRSLDSSDAALDIGYLGIATTAFTILQRAAKAPVL